MIDLATFDTCCRRLPGTTLVIQWGNSHVYKIAEKLFAMGNTEAGATAFVFKTTPLTYEILLESGRGTRAPYLTRGNWVQVLGADMEAAELAEHIAESYRIVTASLTKAARAGLGLS